MHTLRKILSLTLVGFACYTATVYAESALPTYSAEEDDQACLKRTGVTDTSTSERYYSCRADLARKRIIEPSSVVTILSAKEKSFNKEMMDKAQEFDDKSKAIHKSNIEAYNKAFKSWDDTQTEQTERFDRHDHQECVKAGFEPLAWGNPNTEKYYNCRARFVEERASPPPITNKNDPVPTSRAAQFFHRKAEEAQYAFRVIDEQTHRDCTAKGGTPGDLEDPKTKMYYDCRAKLADEQMGPKIAALFRQKSAEAADANAQSEFCVKRGIKKDDPTYQSCKEKVTTYRHCLTQIDEKLTQKTIENKDACLEETTLKLPISMTKGENPAYTKKQLAKAREKMTNLCIHEKKDLEEQYKYTLKSECTGLLDIAP